MPWLISARCHFPAWPSSDLRWYWPSIAPACRHAPSWPVSFSGVLVWSYVLFVPILVSAAGATPDWITDGPLGIGLLSPERLFGFGNLDALSRAVGSSLLINLLVIALVTRFLPGLLTTPTRDKVLARPVLENLALRFLPAERVKLLFASEGDAGQLESALEHELAAVVGSASSRLLLDAARKRTPAPLETVADLVGQAAAQARFSQEVLSGALENMSQGVCVVDRDMRLVAWNSAYLGLFDYPAALIRVGRPVADLLRFNADQGLMGGLMGDSDLEAKIERRLAWKRSGSRHLVERPWPDGRIIEIRGNPMPGGGFRRHLHRCHRIAQDRRGTQGDQRDPGAARGRAHRELEQAKLHAERASEAKTRFLAAVSHDLVQPLNAAQLLTHSLTGRLDGQPEMALETDFRCAGGHGETCSKGCSTSPVWMPAAWSPHQPFSAQ
jgi:PAS domain-containing protein